MRGFFKTITFYLLIQGVAAAEKQVPIAVFEPHDGFVSASTAYGLSWEILQHGALQAGIELIPQQGSWDGAIKRLKNHKIQLIFGVLETPQRQTWLSFSHPLAAEGSMLYTLPSNPVKKLQEIPLQSAVVGAVAQSQHEKLANELGFANIYPVKDSSDLYQMLKVKRLDYVILGTTLARFYCHSAAGEDCLKPVGEVLMSSHIHVVTLKNSAKGNRILNRLNDGLRAVYPLPMLKQLFEKYGFSKHDYVQWQQTIRTHLASEQAGT
ncbi:transporter substrate-binding domain-containing protein [Lacimicrobium sp. SS2-24]|uniref:substrate-binding periplasmic protein n=1 Tax=Lacimicrobium sp. SS2-24 TaxID=2005569 RepID=UPI00143B48EE|nr:transporter substrate-binding domain-containing protein [Lacimicrobium sp. SS2-24]